MRQHVKNRAYRISRLLTNYAGMFTGYDDIAAMKNSTVTSLGYMNGPYTSNKYTDP